MDIPEEVEVLGGGGGVDHVPVDVVAVNLGLAGVGHLQILDQVLSDRQI